MADDRPYWVTSGDEPLLELPGHWSLCDWPYFGWTSYDGGLLADPAGALTALCEAVGIDFHPAMLRWPAGRRPSDGVWAPAWYDAVERSTGFAPPRVGGTPDLDEALTAIARAAQPAYERLARYKLIPGRAARAGESLRAGSP